MTSNVRFARSFYGFSKLTDHEGDEESSGNLKTRRRCTENNKKGEKRANVQSVLLSGDEGSDQTGSYETPLFCPFHVFTYWTKPGTTTCRITIAIVLPTGIGPGNFSTKILEGERILELNVKWPQCLTNLDMLHRNWLCSSGPDHIEKYHPKYLSFGCALKTFREYESDDIQSKVSFSLPFPVEIHIVLKHNLGWKDHSDRVVYIDLKAHSENYVILRDEKSFEMVRAGLVRKNF